MQPCHLLTRSLENWHEDIRDWFDSGVAGVSDVERVLEDAETLMDRLNYGKPQLAHGELSPSFDPRNRRVVFKDAFTFQPTRVDGECLELASWLHLCLSRKHDLGSRLRIVEGTDPDYFRCDRSSHTFLVLKEGDKEWIVDPSFRRIVEFAGSGYTRRGPVLIRSTDLSLFQGSGVPISMQNDGIRYLCWGNGGTYIGEQNKGCGIRSVSPVNGERRLLSSVRLVLPVEAASPFGSMMSGFMKVG